jgi:hypothetical protein
MPCAHTHLEDVSELTAAHRGNNAEVHRAIAATPDLIQHI